MHMHSFWFFQPRFFHSNWSPIFFQTQDRFRQAAHKCIVKIVLEHGPLAMGRPRSPWAMDQSNLLCGENRAGAWSCQIGDDGFNYCNTSRLRPCRRPLYFGLLLHWLWHLQGHFVAQEGRRWDQGLYFCQFRMGFGTTFWELLANFGATYVFFVIRVYRSRF